MEIRQDGPAEILREIGAVLTNDHFVYTAGDHGDAYIAKDVVFTHPQQFDYLAGQLAQLLVDLDVEVVAGPAVGAIGLVQAVARHLGRAHPGKDVRAVYAEPLTENLGKAGHQRAMVAVENVTRWLEPTDQLMVERPSLIFKRGFGAVIKRKKVVVLEDILNSGGTALKLVRATRAAGGEVVGVGAICNRGGVTARDLGDVPAVRSLLDFALNKYPADDCPLCKSDVPINTQFGHGASFLASKG